MVIFHSYVKLPEGINCWCVTVFHLWSGSAYSPLYLWNGIMSRSTLAFRKVTSTLESRQSSQTNLERIITCPRKNMQREKSEPWPTLSSGHPPSGANCEGSHFSNGGWQWAGLKFSTCPAFRPAVHDGCQTCFNALNNVLQKLTSPQLGKKRHVSPESLAQPETQVIRSKYHRHP